MTPISDIAPLLKNSLENSGFTGNLAFGIPLASRTSYGIGGPALLMAEAPIIEDLVIIKNTLNRYNLPHMLLGAGSNILFSDDGFAGAVISLSGDFAGIETAGQNIRAGASVPITALVREGSRIGLEGIVRLAGIPGWVGGAIVMNAGTFGEHIDGILTSIDILTKYDEKRTLTVDQCEFGYRTSRFLHSGEIILGCVISGTLGDPERISTEIQRRLNRRRETQPVEYPSCGSIFKNPPGKESAARLIQEAALKGTRRGHAVISEKHANFIINEGGAKAADVLELMAFARAKVRTLFGITLVPEVQAYGFPTALEVMLDAIDDSRGPDKGL